MRAGNRCNALIARNFGVSVVDPVDQYLQSERAIKYVLLYGMLFDQLGAEDYALLMGLLRVVISPVVRAMSGQVGWRKESCAGHLSARRIARLFVAAARLAPVEIAAACRARRAWC